MGNYISDEIESLHSFSGLNPVAKDILMHYGMLRRSGRYPFGSGENPYQHAPDFLSRIDEMKKGGMSESEIARYFKLSHNQLRAQKAIAIEEARYDKVMTAKRLVEKEGYSQNAAAKKMGISESSLRSLLNPDIGSKKEEAGNAAGYLAEIVDTMPEGKIGVVIGTNARYELDISQEKLEQAIEILRMNDYPTYNASVPQVGRHGQQTNIRVLCKPGTLYKEAYQYDKLMPITDFNKKLDDENNTTKPAFQYPASMDSKRLKIRYAEDGGEDKDGVVELRRGVADLDLGKSNYAQVRIMVDGTHYIKGMAVYGDDKDFPPGVDIIFNTNKTKDIPALGPKDHTVLKPIKKDPTNPFGSLIKEFGGQSEYEGPDGKKHLSLINKNRDEGDWEEWDNGLPAQFLSKQPEKLVRSQLKIAINEKRAEFEEINSLTNPTVKKMLLNEFASNCDSAAVHLKAASLPGQRYHVILPLKGIADDEVYAPNYEPGTKVALVRYPHAGTFEIPILKVNNYISEGDRVIGKNSKDAVGISSKVAHQLSGADFDGDTVTVIPLRGKSNYISSRSPLKELEGFEPKKEYGPPKEYGVTLHKLPYKKMTKAGTQNEMGKISNLITDMTIANAPDDEIVRAVKHSMVVIDAEKHSLDYIRSEKENGIAALKKKYQYRIENGRERSGASTIISRAKGEVTVDKRRGQPIINEDGSLTYKTALDKDLYYEERKRVKLKDEKGRIIRDEKGKELYLKEVVDGKEKYVYEPTGKIKKRTQKSTQMAETNDAYTLVSRFEDPRELAYAEYANQCKSLANEARRTMKATGRIKYSASAEQTYKEEAESMWNEYKLAKQTQSRETHAQMIANTVMKAKKADNPDMTKEEIKKAEAIALRDARTKLGYTRPKIEISDRRLEAIQAGAISENKLKGILEFVDTDTLRERLMPRNNKELSPAKQAKIQTMKDSKYTNEQIAKALGVSVSTIKKYL